MVISADSAVIAAAIAFAVVAGLFALIRFAAHRARQDALARRAAHEAARPIELPVGRFVTDEPEAQQLDAA